MPISKFKLNQVVFVAKKISIPSGYENFIGQGYNSEA